MFDIKPHHYVSMWYTECMAEETSRSELGRALQALRRRVTKRCVICNIEIEGTTKKIYCSNRCRVRAYTNRKLKEKEKEAE